MSTPLGQESDIDSLKFEISHLQRQKIDILKQIEKIKSRKPTLGGLTQLQDILENMEGTQNDQETNKGETTGKKRKRHTDEFVNPAKHEYFDSTISRYFEKNEEVQERNLNNDLIKRAKVNNVTLENVYRMFGITAFPVNDPSTLNKNESSELMGLRVEVFNQTDLKFEIPHYIILQRNSQTGKWLLFKHTIPAFVQIEKLAKEYDDLSDQELLKFSKHTSRILNSTSFKHQVVEKIREELSDHISNLQKDIALETLKFTLTIRHAEHNVILSLGLDDIQSCHIDGDMTQSEKIRISNILKGDISTFRQRLEDVIENS